MSRQLKFRGWDGETMLSFDLYNTNPFNGCSSPAMQYTGLQDKNGQDIYEGDIVQFNGLATIYTDYPIVFDKASFGFYEHPDSSELWPIGNQHPDDMEVIGNIHANPELINPIQESTE